MWTISSPLDTNAKADNASPTGAASDGREAANHISRASRTNAVRTRPPHCPRRERPRHHPTREGTAHDRAEGDAHCRWECDSSSRLNKLRGSALSTEYPQTSSDSRSSLLVLRGTSQDCELNDSACRDWPRNCVEAAEGCSGDNPCRSDPGDRVSPTQSNFELLRDCDKEPSGVPPWHARACSVSFSSDSGAAAGLSFWGDSARAWKSGKSTSLASAKYAARMFSDRRQGGMSR